MLLRKTVAALLFCYYRESVNNIYQYGTYIDINYKNIGIDHNILWYLYNI